MALSIQYTEIKKNLDTLNKQILNNIEKRKELLNNNKPYKSMDNNLFYNTEELKNFKLKLSLLFSETPSNNNTLTNEYINLSFKIENLIDLIEHSKKDKKGSININFDNNVKNNNIEKFKYCNNNNKKSCTNSGEFSDIIKKIKNLSKEINDDITKDQIIIEDQSKKMEDINNNIKSTKYKLNNLMEKSSNLCLIITIIIEVFIFIWIIL